MASRMTLRLKSKSLIVHEGMMEYRRSSRAIDWRRCKPQVTDRQRPRRVRRQLQRAVDAVVGRLAPAKSQLALSTAEAVGHAEEPNRRFARAPRVAGDALAAPPSARAAVAALGGTARQRIPDTRGGASEVQAAPKGLPASVLAERPVAKEGARVVVDAPAVVELRARDGGLDSPLARRPPAMAGAVAAPKRR